jgi:cytochrome c biogenesis protein CcdA
MRSALLLVVLVFIGGLGLLTAVDIHKHGINWLNVLAIMILVLFGFGIVGALLERPRRRN